ncbi:MAG: hypothetical protein KJ944_17130 [Alphaproteobacteria bacterium]|uniref:hypothetical protein n=1 Tax=Devosia sp. XGJD_8 TaxID=3391187 RepID=UPI001DCF0065|nr:hypothetical protein [Alphaproteobacteria bacterium]MBU1561928.1 hypothetical protein [Alphaproteobacteria bacterium]MBU2304316.1 hypothetical protein [Alphaproteobacteria bacterium]MBU2369905.1 hypothetical protein [Alphaproteobacteria bacterium]
MTDDDLTPDELKTLARFQSPTQPLDIDPQVFAKLLSMALIEQKEGGPELTEAGLERVNNPNVSAQRLR